MGSLAGPNQQKAPLEEETPSGDKKDHLCHLPVIFVHLVGSFHESIQSFGQLNTLNSLFWARFVRFCSSFW